MAKKKKKKESKAVAKKDQKAMSIPAGMQESLLADAQKGAGHEAMTSDDMALPFLYLLQDLSPATKKRNEEQYVEGAEPGMFLENVSNTLWDDPESGLLAVPCYFNTRVVEFVKRDEGGGFVAVHETMEEAMENVEDVERHELVDTHQHFLLVQTPDGEWTPVVFPMTSTKLKASRKWNALLAQQTRVVDVDGESHKISLPRFATVWRIRAVETENQKGQFFVPATPELVEDVSDREDAEDLYKAAKAFYMLASAGDAKVDWSRYEGGSGEEDDEDSPDF